MGSKVTVYCLAFNHEKYIRKTLESLVNQKTNFQYKVVVHDDASTDGTANIIREYSMKYPDIIEPIFQEENQYSKGVHIVFNFIVPLFEGDYIAICEGDDYWTSRDKLQLQFDYMNKNPSCSLCVHNTKKINAEGRWKGELFNSCKTESDYSTNDIIKAGGGGLFHLSSYMIRKSVFLSRPKEFLIKGIGDYPLAIWASIRGNVHYFPKTMSAYRVGTPGGWTVSHGGVEKARLVNESLFQALDIMDSYTRKKYHRAFKYRKTCAMYNLIVLEHLYHELILYPKYWSLVLSSLKRKAIGKIKRKL